MKVNRRNMVLGLSLSATLAAVYFAPNAEGNDVELSSHANKVENRSNTAVLNKTSNRSSIDVLSIRSRYADDEDDAALFSASDWTPPKEIPKVVEIVNTAATVEPQAPTVPFHVLGRYVENGKVTVFLQYNDQNLIARVGDTLAESYKVEAMDGGVMTLRYLPLNVQQTLQIGGAI